MSTSTYECQKQDYFALMLDRFPHIFLWSTAVIIPAIVLFLCWFERRQRQPLGDVEKGFQGYRVEVFRKRGGGILIQGEGDERRSSGAVVAVPEDCSICLEEFKDGDERSILTACGHVYHKSCLERWLGEAYKRSCPLCRAHIVVEDCSGYGESSDDIINNHLEHQLR